MLTSTGEINKRRNYITMNAIVERILSILIERFREKGVEDFDLVKELEFIDPVSERGLTDDEKNYVKGELLKAIKYKESHDGAILIPVSVVADPREHEEWYPEWLSNHNDLEGSYYWKRLENYLSRELTRKYTPESAGEVVRSIDEATFTIMQKMANPGRTPFSYKGMVVGYVQSGKTANFTALIAKAADAGYKFIIVLAGIHNVLRRQTQVRLDKELTGVRDVQGPGVYIEQPGAAKAWNRLTTADNDFSTDNLGLFSNYCERETPSLAIVKKNVRVLERLISYVEQASEEDRANMPILVIDDEADQASVDGNANDPDSNPTRTNEKIRELLSLFSRKTYVGYTATPFANALIDMSTEHNRLADDLYPRNFIISLPKPNGYFGASDIFQGDLSGNFVQRIPAERDQLIGTNAITESLARAIDQFLLGCCVRNLRNDHDKPMSMLIHVSHLIDEMTIVKQIVDDYIEVISGRYNNASLQPTLKEEFNEIWNNYIEDAHIISSQQDDPNRVPDFDDVWTELKQVFDVLRIMELNSSSDDRLDYTTGEEMKVIAVGGNQLSRGLTLEGLMISYYLRESRQYDTLLQMARWFGYRQGYEDLTRIHTTALIWDFFEHLALVEEELRSEIYRYEEDELTPLQMALAIRDHRSLNVTAPNKMGAGMMRQTSFSQSLNQTIWFTLDQPEVLRANLGLGNTFIQGIRERTNFTNINGVFLADDKIDGDTILDFLNHYVFAGEESTGGPGLNDQNLLEYINRRLYDNQPELTRWSVAVVGNANPKFPGDPIQVGGLSINRLGRSRKHRDTGYNIGVLTESPHLRIDLAPGASTPYEGRTPQNPLLLLYLVAKESQASGEFKPNPQPNERIDLYRGIDTEHIDLLGLALVLPSSPQEPNSYIGQIT